MKFFRKEISDNIANICNMIIDSILKKEELDLEVESFSLTNDLFKEIMSLMKNEQTNEIDYQKIKDNDAMIRIILEMVNVPSNRIDSFFANLIYYFRANSVEGYEELATAKRKNIDRFVNSLKNSKDESLDKAKIFLTDSELEREKGEALKRLLNVLTNCRLLNAEDINVLFDFLKEQELSPRQQILIKERMHIFSNELFILLEGHFKHPDSCDIDELYKYIKKEIWQKLSPEVKDYLGIKEADLLMSRDDEIRFAQLLEIEQEANRKVYYKPKRPTIYDYSDIMDLGYLTFSNYDREKYCTDKIKEELAIHIKQFEMIESANDFNSYLKEYYTQDNGFDEKSYKTCLIEMIIYYQNKLFQATHESYNNEIYNDKAVTKKLSLEDISTAKYKFMKIFNLYNSIYTDDYIELPEEEKKETIRKIVFAENIQGESKLLDDIDGLSPSEITNFIKMIEDFLNNPNSTYISPLKSDALLDSFCKLKMRGGQERIIYRHLTGPYYCIVGGMIKKAQTAKKDYNRLAKRFDARQFPEEELEQLAIKGESHFDKIKELIDGRGVKLG